MGYELPASPHLLGPDRGRDRVWEQIDRAARVARPVRFLRLSIPKGRSLAGRGAGPKIAQRVGMHKVVMVLAVIALAPGCGSESLGPPTGLGGRGAGGGGTGTGGRGGATSAGGDTGTTGAGATSGTTGGGGSDGSMDTGTSGLNGPCKVSSDCQLGTTCAPAGFPGFCGICFTPAQTCLSDAECTGLSAWEDASRFGIAADIRLVKGGDPELVVRAVDRLTRWHLQPQIDAPPGRRPPRRVRDEKGRLSRDSARQPTRRATAH